VKIIGKLNARLHLGLSDVERTTNAIKAGLESLPKSVDGLTRTIRIVMNGPDMAALLLDTPPHRPLQFYIMTHIAYLYDYFIYSIPSSIARRAVLGSPEQLLDKRGIRSIFELLSPKSYTVNV
jgi:hypothetical protein